MPTTELSIIIPTLNEESTVARLLARLQQQQDLRFEIIIVDGGSRDGTWEVIEAFRAQYDLPLKIIASRPGRGKQMNCGAEAASADDLLFLHADCGLEDFLLLTQALEAFRTRRQQLGHGRVAGHFGLRFERRQAEPSLGYYFYESKTRLNRLDTINGDQGFMLSKAFFNELGGLDESLPYMEDFRLARKIFARGEWLVLPGTLTTSARRFEVEGLRKRQVLNALLCNSEHIGLTEFFTHAAEAYRAQANAGALDLAPFFSLLHHVSLNRGWLGYAKLWYRTGNYVAGNAWQLAFALDCRHNFAQALPPGEGPTPALEFFDRRLRPLIDSPPGHTVSAVLTFAWFYVMWFLLVLRS